MFESIEIPSRNKKRAAGRDSCRGAHCRLRIWSDILINLEKYSTYLIIYRLTGRC